jgi:hypothetical protein
MLQTEASLIDDARVVIYIHNMFIIQATGDRMGPRYILKLLVNEILQNCQLQNHRGS